MESQIYQSLEDLAAPVAEHLVPEIQQSVEVCVQSHREDPAFNDQWIFGTHLWKNTWNRFVAVASFEECPFDLYGKGNDFKLKIGPFVIRHHRIDRKTKIPKGAKAVKLAADARQMSLFSGEWDVTVLKDNIVIAIDADSEDGLREVFIGELVPLSPDSKKYRWENQIPIYLADGFEHQSADIIQIDEDITGAAQLIPEEEIPEVSITLDQSKAKRNIGSEGDK
jgi:hypothetical protein